MLNRIFVLAPLLVVLAACTLPQPVTTRSLTGTQTTPINGVVYSLPRTIIRIKTANMETAISSAEHVADPTRSYILEGQHRFASNDNFDFSIENGLLSSLTVNSQDEVPTVVKRTVSAIGGVLSGVNADRIKGTDSEQARDQVFIFDPLAGPIQEIMGYTIVVTPIVDDTLFDRIKAGFVDDQSCQNASFCVPVTTPVKVHVVHSAGIDVETVLTVVDPTRAIGIQLDRSACSNAENSITFQEGIMTQYDVTRPSEVAECLSIPLDILHAIISAPMDAITGRTARLNAEKGLLTSEIELLKERNRLLTLAAEEGQN